LTSKNKIVARVRGALLGGSARRIERAMRVATAAARVATLTFDGADVGIVVAMPPMLETLVELRLAQLGTETRNRAREVARLVAMGELGDRTVAMGYRRGRRRAKPKRLKLR